MKEEHSTLNADGVRITNIEYENWECHIFGMEKGIIVRPIKGKLPNWFWRKMQYLILGNIWKKIPPSNH